MRSRLFRNPNRWSAAYVTPSDILIVQICKDEPAVEWGSAVGFIPILTDEATY